MIKESMAPGRQVSGMLPMILHGLLLSAFLGCCVVDAAFDAATYTGASSPFVTLGRDHHHRILEENSNNGTTSSSCMIDPMSAVNGLRAELGMISRQARGVLRITSNCQLIVDMLEVALDKYKNETSIELYWYGAESLEIDDVENRSLLPLKGITTFNSDILNGNNTLTFDVSLMSSSSDTPDDNGSSNSHFKYKDLSQVGALLLCEKEEDDEEEEEEGTGSKCIAQALIQKLKPGPAADLLVNQPTYFDNCLGVSDRVRLRWTIDHDNDFIDVGMEYVVAPGNDAVGTWAAFGPASPGVEDRIMGGSDVVVAGFRGDEEDDLDAIAFADDYYIGGYEVCTKLQKPFNGRNYDGVCKDSVWTEDADNNDDDSDNDNDVELVYSHVFEGVALLRFRRKLTVEPTKKEFDHSITLGTKQHFVWAKGPLDPTQGIAEVQFHGYQFGQIRDIDLNETMWSCPPLEGIQLDPSLASGISDIDPSDDVFAQQFEHRAILDGDVVEIFWTLSTEDSKVHIGVRGIAGSSKWISIAVGDSMTDSWAWVAKLGDSESDDPQLLAYRMSGLDASSVRLASMEEQNDLIAGPHKVSNENGRLSFEVTAQWPLPGMDEGSTWAPLIWALGPSWRGPASKTPKRQDEHSSRSKSPTNVDFATGATRIGSSPQNLLLVAHGAMMWFAWLILAPLTGIASRYMRDDPSLPDGFPSWIQLHKYGAGTTWYLNIVGLVLAVVGVGSVGLSHFISAHSKVGIALLSIVTIQNALAMYRPPADKAPEDGSEIPTFTKRRMWSWSHRLSAVVMLILAIVAIITGSKSIVSYDSTTRYGVQLSVVWVLLVLLLFVIYENRKARIAKSFHSDAPLNAPKSPDDLDLFDVDRDEPDVVDSKAASPKLSSWRLVYVAPFVFGIIVLAVLTAITFSQGNGASRSKEVAVSSSASEDSTVTTVAYKPSSSVDAPEGCTAWPPSHIGDGWCDDHTPFNTEECEWDGGDCCNIDAPLFNCRDPSSPNFGKLSPTGWRELPGTIPRNPRYTVTREESLESFVTSYNNYYEFGLSKDIVDEANKHADFLEPDTWYIDISGLVANPMTIDVTALVNTMQLEERLYRHRCVEAWSITAPWIGFPLSKLLDMVQPTSDAAIVQFISWKNFTHSKVQATSNYPWPYTEALTMEEAQNELTMLTVGAFGKLLTPQQGAPIRLNVPWKYGFKSVKSIEKINFLADDNDDSKTGNRRTFWSTTNGNEYGFYANINPDVPHRRWSQATERHYVTGFPGTRLDTTRMNGYQEQVDYMYTNLDGTNIYF